MGSRYFVSMQTLSIVTHLKRLRLISSPYDLCSVLSGRRALNDACSALLHAADASSPFQTSRDRLEPSL